MKVRSYYYCAPKKFKRKYLVNYLISGWTTFVNLWRVQPKDWKKFCKLGISHEEFCLGDGWASESNFEVYIPGGHRCFLGNCFSATMRDGADGVRIALAEDVLRHPENWLYVEYENIPNWRIGLADGMIRHLCELLTRYDKGGVFFGFITPNDLGNDPDKWYCSEVCWLIKWLLGVVKKQRRRVSPLWSAWLAVKAGHELKPLDPKFKQLKTNN
jgi:hypothetical protein